MSLALIRGPRDPIQSRREGRAEARAPSLSSAGCELHSFLTLHISRTPHCDSVRLPLPVSGCRCTLAITKPMLQRHLPTHPHCLYDSCNCTTACPLPHDKSAATPQQWQPASYYTPLHRARSQTGRRTSVIGRCNSNREFPMNQ